MYMVYYIYHVHAGASRGQKKALGGLELELQVLVNQSGSRNLNPGPLQKHPVPWTAKLPLQLLSFTFKLLCV